MLYPDVTGKAMLYPDVTSIPMFYPIVDVRLKPLLVSTTILYGIAFSNV